MLDRHDLIALACGCFAMGLERFAWWEMADPAAVFALGMGLAFMPMARFFMWAFRGFKDNPTDGR